MKTKYLITILIISFFSALSAQNITGNKELVTRSIEIDTFKIINVSQNFEVVLMKQDKPSVSIETDSNLQEFITAEVKDHVLTVASTIDLNKFKELIVTIGYNDLLKEVNVAGKVKLQGSVNLKNKKLSLNLKENTKTALDIEARYLNLKTYDKAKLEVATATDTINLIGKSSSHIELKTNTTVDLFDVNLEENSKARIAGSSNKTRYLLVKDSKVKAGELNSGITKIESKDNSKAYIYTADKLEINVAGKSETYIIGNAQITIKAFKDEAKLQKMKKAPADTFGKLF